jgi:hypothetical protein
LFISDKYVSPSEEIQQFTVFPEVFPILLLDSSRFYDEFRHGISRVSKKINGHTDQ